MFGWYAANGNEGSADSYTRPRASAETTRPWFRNTAATSSSVAATALFILHWGLLNYHWDREAGIYGGSAYWAPPMDETRTVNLQDCTRPIEDWSANLRCR